MRMDKGPNHFFHRDINSVSSLAGAVYSGTFPCRNCSIKTNGEESYKYKSLLSHITKVLKEHFLQENFLFRHLPNIRIF